MPSPHIGAEAITPVISATGRIQGNSAIPVYVYTSIPADRRGLGMAAQPVVFITDSDLVENGGQYKLQGRLTALPVIQMPAGSRAIGMPAIPVYDVTNKAWPPAFNPIVPTPPSSFPPITAGLLLNLQADALALNDGDLVSTWADASGLANDFTAAGALRPLWRANSGSPYVDFDGVDDAMTGPDFVDDLVSFCVLAVYNHTPPPVPGSSLGGVLISKCNAANGILPGWEVYPTDVNGGGDGVDFGYQTQTNVPSYGNYVHATDTAPVSSGFHLISTMITSRSSAVIYVDGVLVSQNDQIFGSGVPASFANHLSVTIGTEPDGAEVTQLKLQALMVYAPSLSPADRLTMEAALKTKYGIP